MHVTGLHIYPVKSTAPTDLERVEVQPWGLSGDRRWLVVDPGGVQMTARERRRLLHVRATEGAGSQLTLTGPHAPPITLDGSDLPGGPVTAEVWDTRFAAVDAGDEAARWFTALLDEPARLIYLDDPRARPVTHVEGRPGDFVSTADAFPVLLANTASLSRLNDWITEDHPDDAVDPLPMRRFRPNIVIESDQPFAEDNWTAVRIGLVTFRVATLCSRCVLTTIDPQTLGSGKEPIRTLARRHGWNKKTYFGMNMVPTSSGAISVGDPVAVLA